MIYKELKDTWVVKNGSIFTEHEYNTGITKVGIDGKVTPLMAQKAIAFNVGNDVAQHIMRLHNERLQFQKEIAT